QVRLLRQVMWALGAVGVVACFVWLLTTCLLWLGGMKGLSWLPAVSLVTAVISGVALHYVSGSPAWAEEARRRKALQEAWAEMNAAVLAWQQLAERHQNEFAKQKYMLRKLREQYERLQAEYDAERARVDANKEEYFRGQFLKTRFLSDYKIEKIGANRQVLLA